MARPELEGTLLIHGIGGSDTDNALTLYGLLSASTNVCLCSRDFACYHHCCL